MSPAFKDNDGRLNWGRIGYQARSAFAVLLAIAVLGGGGWFVYSKTHDAYIEWRTEDDYIGDGNGESTEVVIPRGATSTQIGDLLTEEGVIKSTKTFRKEMQRSGRSDELQYGRYKLNKQIPAATAVEMLLDPENKITLWVTYPEGTTVAEQQAITAKKTGLSIEDVQAGAADPKTFKLPDYAQGKLEGFLFPAKYAVSEPPSAQAIYATQIGQFDTIAQKLDLTGGAQRMGMPPLNVVTTASIIAAEVTKPEDQPMVAAVIYNRLTKGMRLQMDSTVHFAVGKTGTVTTTAEERANPSPYNTYAHAGLPPGPISNPGETALSAALNPAETDALFFVTVNPETGDTRFAATDEEHKANVALFQQWCSENKDKGYC